MPMIKEDLTMTYKKIDNRDLNKGNIGKCNSFSTEKDMRAACDKDNRCLGYTMMNGKPMCLKTNSKPLVTKPGVTFYQKTLNANAVISKPAQKVPAKKEPVAKNTTHFNTKKAPLGKKIEMPKCDNQDNFQWVNIGMSIGQTGSNEINPFNEVRV